MVKVAIQHWREQSRSELELIAGTFEHIVIVTEGHGHGQSTLNINLAN